MATAKTPAKTPPAPRLTHSEEVPALAPEPAPMQAATFTAPIPPATLEDMGVGVSPFMQGSLPPAAAGSDLYARQFYGGSPQPRRRFLPVGLRP